MYFFSNRYNIIQYRRHCINNSITYTLRAYNIFCFNWFLNINITFGNLTILNGTLDLISIPNQNLWQVTSFTSSNGTIYNLPSISYYPFENNSIINTGQIIYCNDIQPFILTKVIEQQIGTAGNIFNNVIYNNMQDLINDITSVNTILSDYELSNQLIYIDDTNIVDPANNNNAITIDTAINYPQQSTKVNITDVPGGPTNAFDQTSGILIPGFAIDINGNTLTSGNSFFKFWYSSFYKQWNFLSGYAGTSYWGNIDGDSLDDTTVYPTIVTGAGPTFIQKKNTSPTPNFYTIPGTGNVNVTINNSS